MKKGNFKGLLFREYYVARKNYGYNLLGFLILVILALLAMLSFKCGNLHRYNHLMDADSKNSLNMMIKFVPAYMATCFFGGASDAIPKDEKTGWRRFRTACPVTPFRLALAKYTCLMITLLFSFSLTFGWLGLHSLLTGMPLTLKDVTTTMVLYSIAVIIIIYMTNICIWARTLEKALIVLMVTVYGGIFIVFMKFPQLMDPSTIDKIDELLSSGTKFLPFTPLIITGAFILGIFCTTMLYKRREK